MEHFRQMEFIDVTGVDIDATYTFLDRAFTPPGLKKRKPSRTSEDDAKIPQFCKAAKRVQ